MPPRSSSADLSEIFHLDLDSPLAEQATPHEDERLVAEDHVQDSTEETAAVVVAGESSPDGTSQNAGVMLSPGFSVPWGRVAPSPDSSQPLQGSWGRLQEVGVLSHVRPVSK